MNHDTPRPRALILYPDSVSGPGGTLPGADSRHWIDWAALGCYAALGVALWWQSLIIAFMVLPLLLHEVVIASTFGRSASGRGHRTVSYASALLPLALVQLTAILRPEWLAATSDRALLTAGLVLWATGSLIGLATAWNLVQSWSPENPLLTERPWIYPPHVLTLAGLWLCHPSLPFAVLLGAWLALLGIRAWYDAQTAWARIGSQHTADALGPCLASLIRARERAVLEGAPEQAPEQSASLPCAAVLAAEPIAGRADAVAQEEPPTDRSEAQRPAGGNGAASSSAQRATGNGAHGPAPVRQRAQRRPMRRPRIDRIVPGLGRISVTPMARCSSSCTVEVTSGGRRRRRHASTCGIARRNQTIDRLVERGQLDILRAIKTGALTIDEVHAAQEAGERQA